MKGIVYKLPASVSMSMQAETELSETSNCEGDLKSEKWDIQGRKRSFN
jgi:hypothetical protein